MPHSRFSGEEISRRGEELYERSLRARVETEENIGKIIAIDIETGDYEIGNDVIATGRRLLAKRPDAATWTKRIGYNSVYALGGTLVRTDIRIQCADGKTFVLTPETGKRSPLDVQGVDLGVSTEEIVSIIRKSRERS